ncbi:Major facilitator superfamily domain, general substrate transporter [Ophiocordyceps sinensis CO18]|uniref:Major facilitator superfamily domain, general substrate transporter n=1 Tax=Ophiocordyceps sinensis (strain Co18 / CGMCC 3.14243) TaxID=911162 RepID=T5A8F2_OPHSC|nr:Major facilitator superfamily domain, general substrate transporter [Ophiocordyceps sinensis CO18]
MSHVQNPTAQNPTSDTATKSGKPSALAGLVGTFTGCGALVALALFLPLPAKLGEKSGVTPGEAVSYSYYVVGAVSLVVALFVFVGLRDLHGEEGKGWRVLVGIGNRYDALDDVETDDDDDGPRRREVVPYLGLMKDSVLLGFSDHRIALGYLGGFVARASTVAISLFIPLFVNTYFISNGFCRGSPNDASPELKKECRAAYVLSSIFHDDENDGAASTPVHILELRAGQLRQDNVPNHAKGACHDNRIVDGRGGSAVILVVVALVGISQIGAIVCSLGSLGQGVLAVELPRSVLCEPCMVPDDDESAESDPLVQESDQGDAVSRVRLKGSIAGVYSLCGGAAILILTKVGGVLFDRVSHGAPFYMMAIFNGVWLVATLLIDASQAFARA